MACLVACSQGSRMGASGGDSDNRGPEGLGSVRLALSVPGGITITSASYTVTGPTSASGTVDLTNSRSSLEFVVGGLAAGDGYTITLTATDTAGDKCASAATPFSVQVLQTTQLAVALICLVGDGGYVLADAGTGSVEIDASVTVVPNPTTLCPTIATFGADNAEFVTGTSTNITTATLPAGASVDYTITSLDGMGMGTLAKSDTGGTFTCTAPGLIELTVTTSPVSLANDAGVCPPQSMSFFITCEPGDMPACDPGLTLCDGHCINVMTNPMNCGTCGTVCPTALVCHDGMCVPPNCPQGDDLCGGVCIPTQADPSNCGGCGITCDTSKQTCQQGVCRDIPPPGGDVVVINDMNLFDNNAMAAANNPLFAKNLVTFASVGPRNAGTVVLMDYGRNSRCFADSECAPASQSSFYAAIMSAGLTVTSISSSSGTLTSIDPAVKVVFLWNPLVPYTTAEINTFKQFASEGGRLVFVGEWLGFYSSDGLALENAFLKDMGAQMTNMGDQIDCGYTDLPMSSLRPHEVTAGLSGLRIACASEIIPGPDDFPLFFDTTNTKLLGAVAKISTVPLLASPMSMTSALTLMRAARVLPALTHTGAGTELLHP